MQLLLSLCCHFLVSGLCLALVAVQLVNSKRCRQSGITDLNNVEDHQGPTLHDKALRGNESLPDGKQVAESDKCQGATCEFRSKCGLAPLNVITRFRLRKRISHAPYIVNGERQVYGEWPSFAKINIVWAGLPAYCSGVVVSNRHILTASHCFLTEHYGQAKADQVSVVLGEDRLWETDPHEKVYSVKSICVAKNYTISHETGQTENDYAVLTLWDDIQFNDHSQPACLPYAQVNTSKTVCFLVGSGVTKLKADGTPVYSNTVQKMPVHEVSCERYGFGYKDNIRECYTKLGSNGDSCVGDSGGPILCLNRDTKRWTVVATVSYGSTRCDGTQDQGWSAVYARISTLLPAIKADCGL